MERQRLQTELLMLTKRQRRINARLAEIREETERLKQEAGSSPWAFPGSAHGGKGPGREQSIG